MKFVEHGGHKGGTVAQSVSRQAGRPGLNSRQKQWWQLFYSLPRPDQF